jgi:DNA-damage-inducible protein J
MTSLLQVRIDKKKKEKAQKIFKNLGMDLTTGVNVFISAVVREKGIPFDLYEDDEDEKELKPEIIKAIQEAHEDYLAGKYYTLEEAKKILKVGK